MESWGGILEEESLGEESWRRNPARGILEEESSRRIQEMESWERNPGGGIPKQESLRRNLKGGSLEEELWKKDPRRAFGGTSREPWRGTQESSGGIWDLPQATRTTFWPQKKSVLKPLCFSAKSGATDLFVCTGARQHPPSTAPAHKSWL